MSVVLKQFRVQGGGVGTDQKKEKGATVLKHQMRRRSVLQAHIFQEDINLSSFLLLRKMYFQEIQRVSSPANADHTGGQSVCS